MNLTIEIDEEVFREAVTSDIKGAIINKVAHYKTKGLIKKLIDEMAEDEIRVVIRRELAKSDIIKNSVLAAMTRKIQGQLLSVMKAGELK